MSQQLVDRKQRRVGSLLLIVATVVATLAPGPADARNKRLRVGVFGKINGKPFKATNLIGVTDPCVFGIYNPSLNQVTFSAIECKGKKRRRQGTAVKRNYKGLAMSCLKTDFGVGTLVPPYEIPCPTSGYVQAKTGRFGIPVSMLEWLSNTEFLSTGITSNLRMRVDAVEGANVRGAIFGVFEVVPAGASAPAAINGEVTFNFPFQVR